jgi:hypothetical protein
MQATQLLKQDHGKAKAGFQAIESAAAGQRGELWRALRPELELHEKMEEMHLYGPAARGRTAIASSPTGSRPTTTRYRKRRA